MCVGKAPPLAGQAVQIGRPHEFSPVTREIAIADVIREDEDNVGYFVGSNGRIALSRRAAGTDCHEGY